MKPLEKALVSIDSKPFGAILRIAIGLAIAPLLQRLSGGRDEIWIAFSAFVGLLIMLRAVPAVLRHILPFSVEAKEIWVHRRHLAKQYDSYQWQKLFWIGLGLSLNAVITGGPANGQLAVMVFCLIGGSLGLLAWSTVDAANPARQQPALEV